MEKEYLLRLNMSNFLGAYVKEMENESGVDEPYLCIPIKRNSFTLYPDNRVISFLRMYVTPFDMHTGWPYSLAVSPNRDGIDFLQSMGYKYAVMGNAKLKEAKREAYTLNKGNRFVRRIDDD